MCVLGCAPPGRLWDLASCEFKALVGERTSGKVYDLVLTPDGATIVAGFELKVIR